MEVVRDERFAPQPPAGASLSWHTLVNPRAVRDTNFRLTLLHNTPCRARSSSCEERNRPTPRLANVDGRPLVPGQGAFTAGACCTPVKILSGRTDSIAFVALRVTCSPVFLLVQPNGLIISLTQTANRA